MPKRECPTCRRMVSIMSNVTRNKLRNHKCVPATSGMEMTSDRAGEADMADLSRRDVPIGTTVTYLAHVPIGMVRVRLADGTTGIMHPHCFPTLRVG